MDIRRYMFTIALVALIVVGGLGLSVANRTIDVQASAVSRHVYAGSNCNSSFIISASIPAARPLIQHTSGSENPCCSQTHCTRLMGHCSVCFVTASCVDGSWQLLRKTAAPPVAEAETYFYHIFIPPRTRPPEFI